MARGSTWLIPGRMYLCGTDVYTHRQIVRFTYDHRRRTIHGRGVAALIIALLMHVLSGCGGGRHAADKLPVRLVMSAQIYGALPVIIAQAVGNFDAEGLAVDIENVQSNTKAVHALAGGSADVSTGNFGQVLSLAAEGRDVKAFTTMLLGAQQVLVASPASARKIRSVGDLRGATVGLGGLGGPGHHFLNWVLDRNALRPSDVSWSV